MDEVNASDLPWEANMPVGFVPAKSGDVYKAGNGMTLRVMEDGSHTDMRLSAIEVVIPPHLSGPPAHFHLMHDETFLVTAGTVRFHKRGEAGEEVIDAKVGDYVVVPPRAAHTFSNPFDVEAVFFSTMTPAFYINYFKLLAEMGAAQKMTPEMNIKAMSYYSTIPTNLGGSDKEGDDKTPKP